MLRLMIVDDNIDDCRGVSNLIDWESLGIEVVGLAENGFEGYNKALVLKPDFIITDVSMPIMDGIEMTEKIKYELPDTKFIFMSCFDEFDYVKSALKHQVVSYILKPIDIQEFLEAVIRMKDIKEDEVQKELLDYQLRQQLRESFPLLQEQFILDLLYGRIKNENEIVRKANYLSIMNEKNFCVILVCFENNNEIINDKSVDERYLLNYKLKKSLENSLFNDWQGYNIIYESRGIAALLYMEEKSLEELLECLAECQDTILKDMGMHISIGVSSIQEKLENASMMFKSAEYAVKSSFYGNSGSIILANDLQAFDEVSNYNLQEIYNEINSIFEHYHTEDIQKFVDRYFEKGVGYTEAYVKGVCYSVVNIINIILIERDESFEKIFGGDMLVWEKLVKFNTILDVKQWLMNVFTLINDYLKVKEGGRYNKIVEDIKNIIENQFATISNVTQIVEPLYLSLGYANRVFKQYTGETIFDYLLRMRMEGAKKLLSDPYCKIYEIAEKVGYTSKAYFTVSFKQYTGMTPKEYRNKYSK